MRQIVGLLGGIRYSSYCRGCFLKCIAWNLTPRGWCCIHSTMIPLTSHVRVRIGCRCIIIIMDTVVCCSWPKMHSWNRSSKHGCQIGLVIKEVVFFFLDSRLPGLFELMSVQLSSFHSQKENYQCLAVPGLLILGSFLLIF